MFKKLIPLVFVSVLLFSAMVWVRALSVHDVAVVGVTIAFPLGAEAVYPCGLWRAYINVTVENQGTEAENFTVTTYYDGNPIETKNVTNLAPGANATLIFIWQTRGVDPCTYNYTAKQYLPYNIYAEASVVPGEVDTVDNTLVDGTVIVRYPGDASGDGHVRGDDLGMVGACWYQIYPWRYDWRVDFNGDGRVNGADLGYVGAYWYVW